MPFTKATVLGALFVLGFAAVHAAYPQDVTVADKQKKLEYDVEKLADVKQDTLTTDIQKAATDSGVEMSRDEAQALATRARGFKHLTLTKVVEVKVDGDKVQVTTLTIQLISKKSVDQLIKHEEGHRSAFAANVGTVIHQLFKTLKDDTNIPDQSQDTRNKGALLKAFITFLQRQFDAKFDSDEVTRHGEKGGDNQINIATTLQGAMATVYLQALVKKIKAKKKEQGRNLTIDELLGKGGPSAVATAILKEFVKGINAENVFENSKQASELEKLLEKLEKQLPKEK